MVLLLNSQRKVISFECWFLSTNQAILALRFNEGRHQILRPPLLLFRILSKR